MPDPTEWDGKDRRKGEVDDESRARALIRSEVKGVLAEFLAEQEEPEEEPDDDGSGEPAPPVGRASANGKAKAAKAKAKATPEPAPSGGSFLQYLFGGPKT